MSDVKKESHEVHPVCTVDGVLFVIDDDKLKVLLHRRPRAPFEGVWALPGGWIHTDKDADALSAIHRVMTEKTGLPEFYLEQLMTYSGPDRDPRGWSVSIAHLALVPRASLPMEDAQEDVILSEVEDLPSLAFDHGRIVKDALARLRGKGAYSSLPAALLPELFTLTDLRRAYELVLGEEKIDASSFRRKIMSLNMIEESGETTKDGSTRPAVLYRLSSPASTFNRTLGTA
jgi:8-oxo-dGTP diphosphatase